MAPSSSGSKGRPSPARSNTIWLVAAGLGLLAVAQAMMLAPQGRAVPYSEFKGLVRSGQVAEVFVGDTTIRGFALDTVGTPKTISSTGFPRGGNAVLILNGELRVPVWREFGAALFADGGNVWERTTDFDIGELRGALGAGLRYRSPVGPIRVDVGFKMDRREFGGQLEPRTVWHFSIGQAF